MFSDHACTILRQIKHYWTKLKTTIQFQILCCISSNDVSYPINENDYENILIYIGTWTVSIRWSDCMPWRWSYLINTYYPNQSLHHWQEHLLHWNQNGWSPLHYCDHQSYHELCTMETTIYREDVSENMELSVHKDTQRLVHGRCSVNFNSNNIFILAETLKSLQFLHQNMKTS